MPLTYETIPLQVKGVNLNLSTLHELSSTPPIPFLHGFGSYKEDLADMVLHPLLQEHDFIAYDAPGCGHSTSDNLSATNITFPRMFMFGEECRGLSYLPRLEKEGVELADIPHSGHFPMYSNPVEMYRRIAAFLQQKAGQK